MFRLPIALLILLLTVVPAWAGSSVGSGVGVNGPGSGNGGPVETSGRVESVQLLDASPLGAEPILILALADGPSFHLPGAEQIAAGPGVEVHIRALPGALPGDLPVACSVRVTGVALEIEGEEVLQPARRPFQVYANPDPACD